MVRERDAPHALSIRGKCRLHERPVLGQLEQTMPGEKRLFRGVDADELDPGAKPEAIEQPGPERGAARRLLSRNAFGNVEVVLDLRAIVVILGFGGVVIADGWIDGDAIDDVTIG